MNKLKLIYYRVVIYVLNSTIICLHKISRLKPYKIPTNFKAQNFIIKVRLKTLIKKNKKEQNFRKTILNNS